MLLYDTCCPRKMPSQGWLDGFYSCRNSIWKLGTRKVLKILLRILSRIFVEYMQDTLPLRDSFPDEQLFAVSSVDSPWFGHIVNYLAIGEIPAHWSKQEKDRFLAQVKEYFWEDPELFKLCPDQIIRRCVPESEQQSVLNFCHTLEVFGHHSGKKTTVKVL